MWICQNWGFFFLKQAFIQESSSTNAPLNLKGISWLSFLLVNFPDLTKGFWLCTPTIYDISYHWQNGGGWFKDLLYEVPHQLSRIHGCTRILICFRTRPSRLFRQFSQPSISSNSVKPGLESATEFKSSLIKFKVNFPPIVRQMLISRRWRLFSYHCSPTIGIQRTTVPKSKPILCFGLVSNRSW